MKIPIRGIESIRSGICPIGRRRFVSQPVSSLAPHHQPIESSPISIDPASARRFFFGERHSSGHVSLEIPRDWDSSSELPESQQI
jgi:hypothetical protein